ncbi:MULTISPECIES: nucleotide sugar dehydrogenase [unclassified Fusibacter]|uniref:nucleotide sugar dehydrogenase n=1 Tax=unclassified Fusibacter TaxID=2624464 RepID=UPI001011835E|nr:MULTISPECIES: nucleotide sugar dehydrogenase [unclassified Fusibacter]MCK8060556.1 nucleotide sugar dehydrogenase [Fusibacter sp. A2]NPE22990.1 nucleotide sugar dehydrogenase [Fusibacter sp. A1]RXV60055.1 nucleotide sugar dehydrogenase [Fusibacter sp. A1]
MTTIKDKKICVIGIGYIGLPTAAMYASNGFNVVGFDVNEHTVNELNKGKIVIEEPYLDDLVMHAVDTGKLRATTVIEPADVFFIAVPTPITPDHKADMRYVEAACHTIKSVLKKGDIVVLESTSPPGTTDDIVVPILKETGFDIGTDIYVAHSPERVIPGRILIELVENSRIVGGINDVSSEAVKALFKTFVKGEIFITDSKTAEMCKLMENTYRDVNIALANELAKICENMGISAWEVRELSNHHPRVNIHMPGPGVGGHCIAVDPWFIVEKHPDLARIMNASRQTNDSMPHHVLNRVKALAEPKSKVVLLGITYKPDVDDMRESPIVELDELLRNDGFDVQVHDPFIERYNKDIYETLKDASLVVLAVNHKTYADIDFDRMYDVVAKPVILDTRNFWADKLKDDKRFVNYVLGSGK